MLLLPRNYIITIANNSCLPFTGLSLLNEHATTDRLIFYWSDRSNRSGQWKRTCTYKRIFSVLTPSPERIPLINCVIFLLRVVSFLYAVSVSLVWHVTPCWRSAVNSGKSQAVALTHTRLHDVSRRKPNHRACCNTNCVVFRRMCVFFYSYRICSALFH